MRPYGFERAVAIARPGKKGCFDEAKLLVAVV
jgi:hypothetical protein